MPTKSEPQNQNTERPREVAAPLDDESGRTTMPSLSEPTLMHSPETPTKRSMVEAVGVSAKPVRQILSTEGSGTGLSTVGDHESVTSTPLNVAGRPLRPSPHVPVKQIIAQRVMPPAKPMPQIRSVERLGKKPVAVGNESGAAASPTVAGQPTRPLVEGPTKEPVVERIESSEVRRIPVQDLVHTVSPTVIRTAPRAIVWPRVTSHVGSKPPVAGDPTAKSTPAPTIQVTIGRIEVRAIPLPTPVPRKKNGTSPVIALAEYLKQRNASKR